MPAIYHFTTGSRTFPWIEMMQTGRIRLSYNFPQIPIKRQTPGGLGVWGGHRFVTDDDADANEGVFDAWVVYNNLTGGNTSTVVCPPERTILVVGEPPSRTRLSPEYTAQFATVITCHDQVQHPNVIHTQQALPWWVGLERVDRFQFISRFGYDELKRFTVTPKQHDLSIVCSNLAITPHHRRRVRFIERLTRHFGDRLALFGEGFQKVSDKWDAIAPFKYHIVLENSLVPHYWTEKLADAFLGLALPIYCGCPNLSDYFSEKSFRTIDIHEPNKAIDTIEALLTENPYGTSLSSLQNSRRLILDKYNLFAVIVNLMKDTPASQPRPMRIAPTRAFPPDGIRLSVWADLAGEAIARGIFRMLR